MSKSTPALLKAIEGFSGEHAGSKQHEPIVNQLQRVVADIHRGSSTVRDTPGSREAASAASASFQRNMADEEGHDSGDGQVRSNKPGEAHLPDRPADITGRNGPSDKLTGAPPPPSRGNVFSNAPSPGLPPGTAEIRRIAAERERSRPDSHITQLEGKGDGNRAPNLPAKAPPAASRIGNAPVPPSRPSGSLGHDEGIASSAGKQPEPQPPFAGESLKGDGWMQAKQKARGRMAASRS